MTSVNNSLSRANPIDNIPAVGVGICAGGAGTMLGKIINRVTNVTKDITIPTSIAALGLGTFALTTLSGAIIPGTIAKATFDMSLTVGVMFAASFAGSFEKDNATHSSVSNDVHMYVGAGLIVGFANLIPGPIGITLGSFTNYFAGKYI